MKTHKINYLGVGAFVLGGFAALIVTIALLTGRTGPTDRYYTEYTNVSGLKYGTQVLFEGYPVGQVEEILPKQEDVAVVFRVELSVDKGWKIPRDSVAQITASGLLAAVSINIEEGKSGELLVPGSLITGGGAQNVFASLSSVAAQVTDLSEHSIKPLLDSLNRSVTGVGDIVESDGQVLVQRLRELADQLSRKTPEIVDDLAGFSASLNAGGSRLDGMLNDKNVAKLDDILNNAQEMSTNLAELSRDLKARQNELSQLVGTTKSLLEESRPALGQSVADLSYVMESVARHIEIINQNLEGASRNMNEFSRQIKRNPGLLMGGKPPRDEAQAQQQ